MTQDDYDKLHANAILSYGNMMWSHRRVVYYENEFGFDSAEAIEARKEYLSNLSTWNKNRDKVHALRTRMP